MSWAQLLRDKKDDKLISTAPAKTVYSSEQPVGSASVELETDHKETAGVRLPTYSKGLLILDANAIIKGLDRFISLADSLVTTTQVMAEIRDKASREFLERLPHALTVLHPTKAAIAAVVDCAEKTGDLGVMSRTDLRLCALALDCCTTAGCLTEPIEPRAATVNPKNPVEIITEAQSEPDEDEDDEGEAEVNGQQDTTAAENDDDDDDEGDWITPDNIHQAVAGGAAQGELFEHGMACVTSDFAMQNTLLHLGVPIVGTSGMRIRELRQWLLRCTSCFTIVTDTTRQFCPGCGAGDTLRRVSYVVNSKGEKSLFINFKKHINTRGTIYNLPKPRGGKRGTNRLLVLREDQLAQVVRGTTGRRMKEKQVALGDEDELAAFGEPPKHRKRNLADPKATSSYHKYNINEKKKSRAAHRK